MGGRRRRPLPRHLRPRRLQPRDDDHGRAAGPQRGPRQPAELARPQAAHRGRGGARARQRRAARLPPRARRALRDGRRATLRVPRPGRPRDDAAQPPLRRAWPTSTRPRSSGRSRRRTGRAPRDRLRPRRAGDQPQRRALPPARGPPPRPRLPAHLRARDHRPARSARASRASTSPRPPAPRVYATGSAPTADRTLYQMEDYIQQVLAFDVAAGRARARREAGRVLHLARPRDQRAAGQRRQVRARATRASPRRSSAMRGAWDELWRSATSCLPSDERVQLLLRLHISHILQVCSPHTADHDAGVPARGLNGEAYRGHVFWDELYVYPFLNFRLPEITRELLMYRYRRLGEARAAAARRRATRARCSPGRAAATARRRPRSSTSTRCRGTWEPDLSHNQRHVNAAIFYNVWHYYQATEDLEFLRDYGAEMMLEIARFWALDRALQPRARPLRDPRRHGPGRVPREVPGRRRGRPAQQRLHERDGRRGSAETAQRGARRCSPRAAARRCAPGSA